MLGLLYQKTSCIFNKLVIATSARILPVSRRASNPVSIVLARLSCALARAARCPVAMPL
jgi:hypothetical protein